jgi:UDP:flavonoid glycosyltransferase YjiC (YdhE family)
MNDDLTKHFERFDKIIYIAFGTEFLPKNSTLESILKFVKAKTEYGFIMSFKSPEYYTQQVIDLANEATKHNLLISPWVPQPTILGNPKTKAFISHGGYNSVIESFEAKVPLIINPNMTPDQQFLCEWAHLEKLA